MSRRNVKRPKVECPVCHSWLRQLGKHMNQKHPLTNAVAADIGLAVPGVDFPATADPDALFEGIEEA